MIRALNFCLVIAVLAAAFQIYGLEHKSRNADKKLAALHEEIAEERETIRRLRAEWSHLNTPARLEKLAIRHLAHKLEDVTRVVPVEKIVDAVPELGKKESGRESTDPISEMLSGTSMAIVGSTSENEKASDPIGDILKGMDQ